MAKSCTGIYISYARCLITWVSKLQTETALATTEAKYIVLLEAARITILLMNLVNEMSDNGVKGLSSVPTTLCKLFSNNLGAVELAKVPKIRPRTKHINTKYHHFCEWVKKGLIKIQQVETKDQIANLFTKNLPFELFHKFCCVMVSMYL